MREREGGAMSGGERLKTILNAHPLEQYKIGTKEDKDEVV